MIVMRLSDGLGNQLFQYAAGQTLLERTGADIAYLTDAFHSHRARPDRPLLLPALVACEDRILPRGGARGGLATALQRLLTPSPPGVLHVPHLCHLTRRQGYAPAFDRITDGMLVSGYFQDCRCIVDGLPATLAAIQARFGPRLEAARGRLRSRYGTGRILALHLRLGDYRGIGDGSEALVPVERIRRVLQLVEPTTTIVVFCDSPKEVGSLALGCDVELAEGGDALEDFAAMASCDDFVIANSTFSWWASVLGSAADKIIWAPADWSRPGRPGSDPDNGIYLPEHCIY